MNAQNNEKQTPLHLAVKEDNVQIVHMLLQKRTLRKQTNNTPGARFDIPDNKEETPLSIAVAQQREACSKLMIEFGADVSVLYATAVHEEPHTEAYDRYGFLIPKDTPAHPKLDKYVFYAIQLTIIGLPKYFLTRKTNAFPNGTKC